MAWHRFKVKGKHYMTKRMRTLDIIARSDVIAKQKAITKKLLPPFTCEEIPFDPPTDKLLEQAAAAGIDIPANASGDDIACLIERKDDIDPPAGLIAFAERWDIYFPQYIGNRQLYNLTFKNLPPESKSAFFVFSVYKFLSDDKKSNLDTHPYKDIFYKFAAAAADDRRLLRSIANYKGENLCTFGTSEDLPQDYKAGGIRTIAYRTASAFIEEYFDAKYLPRPFKNETTFYIDSTAADSPAAKNTAIETAVKDAAAAIQTADGRTPSAHKPPAVFIISKNDAFIPTKAIELKNKIIKIPDLENKAAADLPVYSPKGSITAVRQEYAPIKPQGRKAPARTGCLTILGILIIIIILIFSLIF